MNKAIGRTLVAGAGLSGIRSALDLAETGFKVLLIDKADHIGGLLCQLDYQFPTSTCGYCRMLPMFDRDRSSQHCLRKGLFHENIEILLSTELISVQGEPGDLNVTLKQNPSLIDSSLCTGCGECERVCPVLVNDPFNEGFTKRKAVYLPTPQSFSNAYTIDYTACTRCGECEKICSAGAIKFTEQDREKFKILVVDDEKIVRDSMKEWLKEEGFFVKTADSGQKALDLMDEQLFNMLLTDIKMPGMDGVELLARAKQKNEDLCVIMMTAYAAVDSAVDAMKQGALDYLTKPFDPDILISMVLKVYHEFEIAEGRVERVDAFILAGGTQFFRPELGKNPYGYGVLPGVLTGMEFERLISGTGPEFVSGSNRLIHPKTGKPVRKIAWFQCVGSRDVQAGAQFCSSVCCMISIKEAILAREKFGPDIETTIFYMDMRTIGKSFDEYKRTAQQDNQVRFVRARIHSLSQNPTFFKNSVVSQDSGKMDGNLVTRYADIQGVIHEEDFDLVVLATGQRPARQMTDFAIQNNIETNTWGFVETLPFSMVETSRPGILSGGSLCGLKDIGESVTCASAAAFGACKIMHGAGRRITHEIQADEPAILARENPRILTVLCSCNTAFSQKLDIETLKASLEQIPEMDAVEIMDKLCMDEGKAALADKIEKIHSNRLVLGACLPCIQKQKIREIGKMSKLHPSLVETLDMVPVLNRNLNSQVRKTTQCLERELKVLISRARFKNPVPVEEVESNQNALVIGGGIAGITAALSIADCGYHVDLVEKNDTLGGNLLWMDKTVDGLDIQAYLAEKVKQLESHDHVTIHKQTNIEGSGVNGFAVNDYRGRAGEFSTVLNKDDDRSETIFHGVTILATGGNQAPLDLMSNDPSKNVLTQKEFEIAVHDREIDPENLDSVVMIQCSGTRDEKQNYCSRVCCIRALKNALFLKEKNPDVQVFIFYRDMMSYGFFEEYYTRAKNIGVVFFQYDPENKPVTQTNKSGCLVKARDILLDMPVEIQADCVIHATGILPDLPKVLADQYGATRDEFYFFKEADPKFRPVDSMNYRVFSCGLSLKPCTIEEAISSAQACAVRAMRILSHERLVSGKTVATTRAATCSMCEMCVDTCPYGARFVDVLEEKIGIDPGACQGCGVCAAVCPSGSAVLEGFDARQMLDVIDMALL
ncbi:response regulator [Desulfobacula toluolica]|uniref:HdlA5: heterodisulfide reductase-like protein, iron-sulfur subunit n=1 Tax=Desulfobacula toluolica (strain DSM 7467 / Tol2) TaxID=651182 RepID=K0NFN9_DESTT|nr:response regulator [Desulfobacula toluolica]CCK79951.1 HdlA5: heterodisulfide reductase-like protein, iron-sulfur subunit [Desulfobacula toluolica Tol2]